MSDTLLVIHSHGKAKRMVWELWPWFIGTGFDILGVHAEDEPHQWPEGVEGVAIGKGGRQLPHPYLCHRLVDTFRHLLLQKYDKYKDFLVTEYDTMFLRVPPQHPGGLFSCKAGGPYPGFKCQQFFHPPWWADRDTAHKIVDTGLKLLADCETEHGSTDMFLGLIVDRAGIKWTDTGTWTCQNSGDGSDLDVRLASDLSVFMKQHQPWCLHGVKTVSNRDLILRIQMQL